MTVEAQILALAFLALGTLSGYQIGRARSDAKRRAESAKWREATRRAMAIAGRLRHPRDSALELAAARERGPLDRLRAQHFFVDESAEPLSIVATEEDARILQRRWAERRSATRK